MKILEVEDGLLFYIGWGRKNLSSKLKFEQRRRRNEDVNHVNNWREPTA